MIKKRKYQLLENDTEDDIKITKLQKISTIPIVKETDLEELIHNIEKLSLQNNEVVVCDINNFNNFFTEELEEEITKKTICLDNDELYDIFFKYREEITESNYFQYGENKDNNLCEKSIKIKKVKQKNISHENKELVIETCTLNKNQKLYHGTLNYFEKLLNKEMWLSFVKKQSILHALDEFYSYIIQSDNIEGSLYEYDSDGKKYIKLPLLYEIYLNRELDNIVILDDNKLKELSNLFGIRFTIGDTSDYDLIKYLKQFGFTGWINKSDQCQLLIFEPDKVLQINKTTKKNSELNFKHIFDAKYLKKIEDYILKEKQKLSNVTDKILRSKSKKECNNQYVNFSNEFLEYIKDKYKINNEILENTDIDIKNELLKYNTNVNSIKMRFEIEKYIKKELCNKTKTQSIEFIKNCHDSIEKFVQICIVNCLRPYIYNMILDIQKKLNGCAKIIVGGRETSNLSIEPEYRVISTDIDTKIFLNFPYPKLTDRNQSKMETLYYVLKQKFVNKMFYEVMPEIIEIYQKYYKEHIFPMLYKLENTFEMKILDVKFCRPENDWLKKRFTLLEATIDKPLIEDHIELFVIDMIIPQIFLPYVHPTVITEKFVSSSTTYGLLDMPITGKKGLFDEFQYYITNEMKFKFDIIENNQIEKAIRIQNDNFKLVDTNEFKKLYFVNKKYETHDKERLLSLKLRSEDKMKKDALTLEALLKSKCKTNNNVSYDYLDDRECLKINVKQLFNTNIDTFSNYLNTTQKLNDIINCGCYIKTIGDNNINSENTVLTLGIIKSMRYLAPMSMYKKLDIMFKDIFDDRSFILNKLFDFDSFDKDNDNFRDMSNSKFWKQYNLTDQEINRIDNLKYIQLEPKNKGKYKNEFLNTINEYTTSIVNAQQFLLKQIKNNKSSFNYNYIIYIKNKFGKLLYGFPTGKLDESVTVYLTFEDMFYLIWKFWCNIISKQTFLFPFKRYQDCKTITNNFLFIKNFENNLMKIYLNQEIEINELDEDQFEKLLLSINNEIVVYSQYKNDIKIQEKLKKEELEDELTDIFEELNISMDIDIVL